MQSRHFVTRALAVGALAAAPLAVTPTSSATVHEITGMLCAIERGVGSDTLGTPPGITGENGASHRGEPNLALPLFATGFATFDPTGGPGGDALISFDEDHPASKINLTGAVIEIEDGLYVTDFEFTRGSWQECFR